MAVEAWRVDNPCTETESYLHESNWFSHVARRPEIQEHQLSARDTVNGPDFAIAVGEGVVFKYKLGYGSGKTEGLWLVVIEEADSQGAHYVKSMYFTRDIAEGVVLCLRNLTLRRT